MKAWVSLLACSAAMILTLSACSSDRPEESDDPFEWRSDWALERNFSISIDTDGYQFPTSIAFIPDPGELPEDPLYFVTELRGKVRVVTNDRTVYTFAEGFFELAPKAELPSRAGQIGMAGICLEPKRGYVFVTFAYEDAEGVLRNNIVRFQSKPVVFGIKPSSQVAFTDVFASYESNVSHQIGPCQVDGDLLYVSVGDARRPVASQRLDSLLGKVVRMNLDGTPVKDNPFYQDNDVKNARNYVWAYGLRNPFGLKIVEGRVFVADNGLRIDRFLQAQHGENYLWDGTDLSIGVGADLVISPGEGVAQLDYYYGGSLNFPQELADSFFLAIPGSMESVVPAGGETRPSILRFKYELRENALQTVPETFLRYRGNTGQIISGVQLGPDGLYFVSLLPNQGGVTAIYKVIYEPR